MRQTVYLDILLLLNILVTYLLLTAAKLLSGVETRRYRMVLSVLLGGAFSFLIFLKCSPFEEFAVKLLTGFSLTAAAFYQKKKSRLYWRVTACFFLSCFLFAGFMMVLFLLFPAQGMLYRNGVLYFNISAFALAFGTTGAYLLVRIVCRILDKRTAKTLAKTLTISHKGNTVTLRALVDTGNRARDPFTSLPVAIVSAEKLQPLISKSQHTFLSSGIPPDSEAPLFRPIPVKTVAGEQLLFSFIPQKTEIDGEEKRLALAVSAVSLSDGGYDAILPAVFAE